MLRFVGLLLALAGCYLVAVARMQLGESWTLAPEARRLVTWGLYSKIRHPMYVFHFVMTVGVVLALQWEHLWMILPLLAIIQCARARAENRILLWTFKDRYIVYKHDVWF